MFLFDKFKMYDFEMVKNHLCIFSLGACFLLSILFVASLYIWNSPEDRNHPTTIKKRFCSVFLVMVASLLILQRFLIVEKFADVSYTEALGIRLPGLFSALVFPLLLTMILFLGPLAMHGFSDFCHIISNPSVLLMQFTNLIWLRNIVVAPISEEFTFRACMMPLLLQCFKPLTAVVICGLFFGLGHIHHMLGRFKAGYPVNTIVLISCCEFFYTALFGAYSAFLFVRTGHFVAPLVAHSFCNIMGFPEFNRVFTYKNPKKIILICLFVAGIVFWAMLLLPLTNHRWYNNTLFWKED